MGDHKVEVVLKMRNGGRGKRKGWAYTGFVTWHVPCLMKDHDAKTSNPPNTRAAATVVALFTSVSFIFGQTKIVAPENKYSVEGRRAGRA